MLDLKKLQSKIDKALNEETNESLTKWLDKKRNKDKILSSQLERFHQKANFEEFVEKVINKYDSNEYVNRWLNRRIEPQEKLYWFLFVYVKKYGRRCLHKEWDKYSNEFTSELYYYKGYYFNQMNGQGSVIQIIKK